MKLRWCGGGCVGKAWCHSLAIVDGLTQFI